MSNKRSAVKPSEFANVALKNARSSTRDFIRTVKALHYATVKKDKCRGRTVALTETFVLGFENIKVNTQNVIPCFIKSSLVTVYYI
jgi:hypothetical protein